MRGITPHLWFDTQAVEAAELYVSLFDDSRITDVRTLRDTPSGDADVVSFVLAGQPFQAISAGPAFSFNPSVSFAVACPDADEVDRLWASLHEGGTALMPLDAYPFNERFGWTTDRYGLSWQLMVGGAGGARITPTMLFAGDADGRAGEAIEQYVATFPDSGTGHVTLHGPEAGPAMEGSVAHAGFTLAGCAFAATDGGPAHDFTFNEAVSFVVSCDDQDELDRIWDALSAVPEAEQCGWLKDRFGVSWQVVPAAMDEMLRTADDDALARVTAAFLEMARLDLATLERAHRGEDLDS